MTQLLEIAIEKAKTLSEAEQDIIAALLLNAIAQKSDKRPVGLAQGLGHVHKDFNNSLPDQELTHWYKGHAEDPIKKFK